MRIASSVALLVLACGCAQVPPAPSGALKGTATYKERMALPAGASAGATLENTYWKLVRLGEQAITVANWSNEPHLLLHPDTKRMSGSGGCNRLAGGYQLDGEALSFGRMAGTLMACMEGMETERSFHEMLPRVRKARVQGRELELLDAEERPLARFEARDPK
jgi:heat shock protein HslJ